MSKLELNKKRISFRTKSLTKAKDIRIVNSNGSVYVEILPEKHTNQLNENEVNEIYTSFIKLGRDLYTLNKNNISKIKCYTQTIMPDLKLLGKYFLGDTETYLKSINRPDIISYIEEWAKKNGISPDDTKASNSFLLLKTTDWNYDTKFRNWLKSNFVPIITEVDENSKWMLADDGRLVDMAIFFYLVTYAINKSDNIRFEDFIEIEDMQFEGFSKSEKELIEKSGNNITDLLYLNMINDIIHMFELHNIHSLHGYNKLVYNLEEQKYEMTREYNNVYGMLWYIFKLQITDSYIPTSYKSSRKIPISICDVCGNPFLGNKIRCEDCDIKDDSVRKVRSRKRLASNIERIRFLIRKNVYSPELTNKTNDLLNKKKSELDRCKWMVDELLERLEKEKL